MKQYAIRDQAGELFGLPAKTFDNEEAAKNAYRFLQQTRERLRKEAAEATSELAAGNWDNETAARERDLEDAVDRWRREQPRQWTVVVREVTEWTAIW